MKTYLRGGTRWGILKTALLALLAIAHLSDAKASSIGIPAELQPGDTYRIFFITSTTTNALSSDISYYNSVVTAAALSDPNLAALSASWFALASTAAVNALENTGLNLADTQSLFFNTIGEKVAIGVSGGPNSLYGGISFLSRVYHEDGGIPQLGQHIWTGTDVDGMTNCPLGAGGCIFGPLHNESLTGLTGATVNIGDVGFHYGWTQTFNNIDISDNYLYGVSGLLTVPDASTPEPGTLALVGVASVLLGFCRAVTRPKLSRSKMAGE